MKTTKNKAEPTTTRREQFVERMRARGFVTVKEASELSLMGAAVIYQWAQNDEIVHERQGRSVFVSLADLRKKVPSMDGAA